RPARRTRPPPRPRPRRAPRAPGPRAARPGPRRSGRPRSRNGRRPPPPRRRPPPPRRHPPPPCPRSRPPPRSLGRAPPSPAQEVLIDVEPLVVQRVPHAIGLGAQVALVVGIGRVLDRHLGADREPVALQPADLLGVVGQD